MPLYEYQCRSCGTSTDVRHGFDDVNTEACPACGGELARVFSAGGIVFKGSGFYINDSKPKSGGSSDGGGGSSSGSSSGSTSSGGDTKSAA